MGGWIRGLAVAWFPNRQHNATLYEAAGQLGDHTNTVDVALDGASHRVDRVCLVRNDLTDPNLDKLFEHRRMDTNDSRLYGGVQVQEVGTKPAGTNLRSVFGQRFGLRHKEMIVYGVTELQLAEDG